MKRHAGRTRQTESKIEYLSDDSVLRYTQYHDHLRLEVWCIKGKNNLTVTAVHIEQDPVYGELTTIFVDMIGLPFYCRNGDFHETGW